MLPSSSQNTSAPVSATRVRKTTWKRFISVFRHPVTPPLKSAHQSMVHAGSPSSIRHAGCGRSGERGASHSGSDTQRPSSATTARG